MYAKQFVTSNTEYTHLSSDSVMKKLMLDFSSVFSEAHKKGQHLVKRNGKIECNVLRKGERE